MRKSFAVSLFLLFALFSSKNAYALGECGLSCCLAGAATSGVTLAENFGVSLVYENSYMKTIKNGGHEVSPDEAIARNQKAMKSYKVPTEMTMQKVSFVGFVPVTERFQVLGSLPYVINDMDMRSRSAMKGLSQRICCAGRPADVLPLPGTTLPGGAVLALPKDAVVAATPTFNHPLSFWGYAIAVGYSGHLWSHGIDYREPEAMIGRIYQGGGDWRQIAAQLRVTHIFWGPMEKERYGETPPAWRAELANVSPVPGYELYAVGPGPTPEFTDGR